MVACIGCSRFHGDRARFISFLDSYLLLVLHGVPCFGLLAMPKLISYDHYAFENCVMKICGLMLDEEVSPLIKCMKPIGYACCCCCCCCCVVDTS